jgi:hypothetical protein
MVASRANRPHSGLELRARRDADSTLTRNILITGAALVTLAFGSAGTALLGGDSYAAPAPYVASHNALKIALTDPVAPVSAKRDPLAPVETPGVTIAVRQEPRANAPVPRDAIRSITNADPAVPLPPARPAPQAAIEPDNRFALAFADPDTTGSLGDVAPRAVKTVSFVAPQSIEPEPVEPKLVAPRRVAPGQAARPKRPLTPHEKLYGPVRLAALTPASTMHDFGAGQPRAPYDLQTAVYVIGDKTVYLPDGRALEAHSGLGDKMDDPRFVHLRMRGATPPHVYDLTMRERPFHGVEAIRLTPVGGEKAIFNRDGLLAHTYLLGANGQSNGCVSFKDYSAFLTAFKTGKITRLAVIPRLD